MSLQVWLPLNGDLHNQGLGNYNITMFRGTETYHNKGKIGKCFHSNGVNTIKIINIIPDFYNYTGYSLSAWFYIETNNTSHSGSGIISAGNWNNQILNLALSGWSTDHYTQLQVSGTSWNKIYTYNFSINTWYHVVVSSDGNKTYAYVNGELIGNTIAGFLPTSIEGNDIAIGGATYYAGMQFFGRINDVRVYNHCLSPKEVKEISKGLILHYKLNGELNGNWLLPNYETSIIRQSSGNTFTDYSYYSDLISCSETSYIVDFYAKGSVSGMQLDIYFRNSSGSAYANTSVQTLTTSWKHYQLPLSGSPSTLELFRARCYKGTSNDIIYIRNMKLISNNMPVQDTNIYDFSGYSRTGITNAITISNLSPKNIASTIFNGNSSYIKCNDTTWMVQGTQQLTINIWAKATTWPTNGGRLFSCTESGGFNLEAGNSGYWRFPIHVYTAADLSATAYKYDSKEIQISSLTADTWNMITCVYDDTGTKTYINGILHHTYSNVSYGIHFNTNARLFLGCEANTATATTPYFNGQECDFRIYTTALSADDIKELYNTSKLVDSQGNKLAREVNSL